MASLNKAELDRPLPLSDAGSQVFKLFERLLRLLTYPSNDFGYCIAAIENDEQRFLLWARNLGLLRPAHSSLDYRLQNAPTIRRTVYAFLEDLANAILEGCEALEREGKIGPSILQRPTDLNFESANRDHDIDRDVTHPIEDLDSIKLVLETLVEDTADIMDKLYELAFIIRSPGARNGFAKLPLAKYFNAKETELLEQIESHRLKDLLLSLRRAIIGPPQGRTDVDIARQKVDDVLIPRLAHANTQRRQQFLYWKRREKSLSAALSNAPKIPKLPARITRSEIETDPEHGAREDQAQSSKAPPVSYTVTKIKENPLSIPMKDLTPSVATRSPTVYGLSGEKVDWPSPPNDPPGLAFECPYCFVLCPPRYRNTSEWSSHLVHDLQPYCCTYAECANAHLLYDNRNDWLNHERTYHRTVWRCFQHPDLEFPTREIYCHHMTAIHSAEVSDSLNLLKPELLDTRASVPIIAERDCPLCCATIESAEEMECHLAYHLESLALFSLPKTNGPESDTQSKTASIARQGVRAISQGSRKNDFDNSTLIFSESHQLLSQEIPPHNSNLVVQLTQENLDILQQEFGYDASYVNKFIDELSEKSLPSEPSSEALRFLEASRLSETHAFASPQDYTGEVSLSLAIELRNARIAYKPHNYFVPLSDLKRLITATVIEREILASDPEMMPADARMNASRVEMSAKKMFAALAYLQKGTTICSFLDSGLSDRDLPFSMKSVDRQVSMWRREPEQRIQTFDEWDNDIVEDFARTQWAMISPVFDKNKRDCLLLEDECILPFISVQEYEEEDEGVPYKIGLSSEATTYRIHPAHHNFWHWDKSIPLEKQPLITNKKLISGDTMEFLIEKTTFDAFGPDSHPYIVKLLATYRMKKCYHLIFPYTEFNLRDFWTKNAMPNFDKETVLWSVKQMLGIADGLNYIHSLKMNHDLNMRSNLLPTTVNVGDEKFGCHGNIKAENLLWFEKEDILKFTGFELGIFHTNSQSGIDSEEVVMALSYEPPECTTGKGVSQAFDIWSLGCVFLEFITWLLAGCEQIDAFADARSLDTGPIDDDNFFTIDKDKKKGAEVRKGVIEWVARLHAGERCSELIHDLLDMIMGAMLRIEPSDRIRASNLTMEIEKLVRKAESSDKYLQDPSPRLPKAVRFATAGQ